MWGHASRAGPLTKATPSPAGVSPREARVPNWQAALSGKTMVKWLRDPGCSGATARAARSMAPTSQAAASASVRVIRAHGRTWFSVAVIWEAEVVRR